MLCKFEKVIFPKGASASAAGFMIALYKPCGVIRDAAGNLLHQIKAVGYCLPTSDKIKYRLEGKWSKNSRHGIQFEVERYEEVVTPHQGRRYRISCSAWCFSEQSSQALPRVWRRDHGYGGKRE